MSWRLARSLESLRAEVDARWPDRDRTSDGTIGDPAHSARTSDHNPDHLGVVRALDLDDNDDRPEAEGIGRVIAEHIRRTSPAPVKYLIYHGQICAAYAVGGHPPWAWRPYSGPNAHLPHLHVSVMPDAVADQPYDWGIAPQEEDPLSWDQELVYVYDQPATPRQKAQRRRTRRATAGTVVWSTRARVEDVQDSIEEIRETLRRLEAIIETRLPR